MSQAIVAAGVSKCFGKVRAVDGLDLSVPTGAIFGVLGENGAGKTTLIKMLLGVARPDAGDLQVLGRPAGDLTARRRIGYLPENLQLPPSATAAAFLHSVGRLKGLTRARMRDEVPRQLEAVGLAARWWSKRTGTFSKGMRQRTGLAAALLGSPSLLVLDEPTDGVDPLGRARIREIIGRAAADGATVFLNSHLLAESEKICDAVAIMARGRVVLSGDLAILRSDDRYLVDFAAHPGAAEVAQSHGFVVAEQPDLETLRCHLQVDESDELSAALAGALAEGLRVRQVLPATRDLEQVMADAVQAGGGGDAS